MSAVKIIRNLCQKTLPGSVLPWGSVSAATAGMAGGTGLGLGKHILDLGFSELDPSVLQDTMLMAFDVDQWLNFDVLWPHTDGLTMST
ncbi:hypothetical protein SEUCBS139899_003621 [Sporothrix eucalyptigena]